MSCTALSKAAKAVWAKQLTQLPCLNGLSQFSISVRYLNLTKRPGLGHSCQLILLTEAVIT